jgi:flavodoxin
VNALVLYYSKFGTTRGVAEAIADTLKSKGAVRVVSTDDLAASDLAGSDLVVMGSPTHRMKVPEGVQSLLKALPGGALQGACVATFDTSYKMSALLARFTAAPKLGRALRRLGGRQVVPAETFHVVDREGPLCDGEIGRARAWAGRVWQETLAD